MSLLFMRDTIIPQGRGCQESPSVIVLKQMVVSMLLLVLELPETTSLKDKRKVVSGIKHRLHNKFRLSCSEVDLQDSLGFAEIGAALVSNSPVFGEKVLNEAVRFVEENFPVNIYESQIHSEVYG